MSQFLPASKGRQTLAISDDNQIVIKKRNETPFEMPNDSMAGSTSPEFAKSLDEFYAAKADWLARTEKSLTQRPTEEEIQRMTENDPAEAQHQRVPRWNDKSKRYKRKKPTDKTTIGHGKGSELSAFANLSIDDEKPLASDEEYVEIPDLDVMQWTDKIKKAPNSKVKKSGK